MPYMLKWCLAVRSLGVLEVIRHAIECLGSLTLLPCPLCLATGLPIILMVAVYSFIWLTFFGLPNILSSQGIPKAIQVKFVLPNILSYSIQGLPSLTPSGMPNILSSAKVSKACLRMYGKA